MEKRLGEYSADLFIAELGLIIEIDGPWHISPKNDAERDRYLEENYDCKVLRIPLKDLGNLENILMNWINENFS